MSDLFEITVNFLKMDNWPYTPSPNQPVIKTGFQGDSGKWSCLVSVDEDQQQVGFYSILPANVSESRRPEMAYFLTGVNYGLVIGNFEMDLSDGEVRYKTSLDVEGALLTPELLRAMLYNNVGVMDKYLTSIMAFNYSDKSALEALNELEDKE